MERYGAFVDLGAERPGLLHVREMGSYVRQPSEVVKEGEEIEVRILRVDPQKRQVDLSMDLGNEPDSPDEEDDPFLSSMEMAFREAQGPERSKPRNNRKRGKRAQKWGDKEMEDIYRHTLERTR